MKGIKLRRIITTVIIIAMCIYVIPIIASMMFKSSFRDLYVGIEKEISEDIGVVEAKVSKSEGYIHLRKKREDIDDKVVLEKMFNTPEVNYAYINKIDRLPEDAIIDGILWTIDEYNKLKLKIEEYTGVYISPIFIIRILAGYIIL